MEAGKWLKHPVIGLFLLSLVMTAASCARVTETRFLQEDARYEILVASGASDFKDAVRSRIVEHYRPMANIEVIPIQSLGNVDEKQYDAMVIMDTCLFGNRLNVSMRSFLDDLENKDRLVLFFTMGSPEKECYYGDVDAVTSASAVGHEQAVFETLKGEIDRILFGQDKKMHSSRILPC